ncbi:4-methyl-5(b-hydroxyethyl)-thiazole monophosphate biosynthesis [Alteromonadaceae bacterium 2753L.S.0a.02]|nr:4-methyl-5(b-hydroxyethyl)-thiazole monophosphate biosynthesis [Alteromonadaceae bacterium 2753L.S.0a.02]
MVKVLVAVADGTEEMEAVTITDVLVRAGAQVCTASVMPQQLTITASRGIKLMADCLITDCAAEWDLIALPGGMPGAEHLSNCAPLIELIRTQLAADKWLGAICAAPAVVLGRHQLISLKTATCYPGFQAELAEQVARISQERVVVDGKLVTSQGPGSATEFALTLVQCLFGSDKAQQVAEGLLFPW